MFSWNINFQESNKLQTQWRTNALISSVDLLTQKTNIRPQETEEHLM